MEKDDITIPEGVQDKEAYAEYLNVAKHPILNSRRVVETSDGQEITLASFPHVIQKKITGLPVSEQSKIMTQKEIFSKINNKATALKRKAFGFKQGRQPINSEDTSLVTTRREELLEYFGRMFDINEVVRIANTEWGLPIGKNAIEKFRKDNATEIDKLTEKHKATYADIRLGVKRSRLEELVYLYNKQKEKYELSRSRDDYKLLLTTLEQIRKEAEGDRLTIDGKVDVTYEANIQSHLREEVFKSMNLKEIILGRVAARMNINPVKLIYSLHSSFYSKFSNVLGDFDENQENKELAFPSQMNYNFERIEKYHVERDKEVQDAVVVEEKANTKDFEKAKTAKEIMIEKLRRKKEAINNASSAVKADVDIKKSK